MPGTESKTCRACGLTKPLAEFYKHAQCALGVRPECKVCTRRDQKTWRDENPAQARQWARESYERHGDRRRRAMREYQAERRDERNLRNREWYAANAERERQNKRDRRDPVKERARHMVNAAIATGALVREPCLACDDPVVEGHHHDYDRPLEVTWLCRKHHRMAHRLPIGSAGGAYPDL